jgi:hypothetical protein
MDSDSKNASSQSDDDLKQLITCELCHQIFEGNFTYTAKKI